MIDTVVFDIGNVLLAWDPRAALRMVYDDEAVEAYLEEVDFLAWNHEQDSGRTWAEGEAELVARFPHHARVVPAYREHFHRTITGPVEGTWQVVEELREAGVRLLALTNWSAELFPWARSTFAVLDHFEGIVVSGEERIAKPDPAVFDLLVERYRLAPQRTAFVDDSPRNVAAAADAGLHALAFTDAGTLRRDLSALGLPVGAA